MLSVTDIDFNKKIISIRRSLSCTYCNGEKKEILTTPKTTSSMRDIPFIGEMEEILISQREKQAKLKKELGKRWRGPKEFDGIGFILWKEKTVYDKIHLIGIGLTLC